MRKGYAPHADAPKERKEKDKDKKCISMNPKKNPEKGKDKNIIKLDSSLGDCSFASFGFVLIFNQKLRKKNNV